VEARSETVPVTGGEMAMPLWLPPGGTGPAILLVQEIFGVGAYIRHVAEDLAGRGYVVGAPDLFWRLQPGFAVDHDEAGLQAAFGMVGAFDFRQGVADSKVALAHLGGLPEVAGGVGLLGFCLGGALGYFVATETGRDDLDVLVSFYGSSVPEAAGLMGSIACPALFVFGGADPYIPRDQVALVEAAAAGRDHVTVEVFETAGHAFHNHEAPMFHDPEAAPLAWDAAVAFLGEHLPA
jgi:carboxymethylenebutenolidase